VKDRSGVSCSSANHEDSMWTRGCGESTDVTANGRTDCMQIEGRKLGWEDAGGMRYIDGIALAWRPNWKRGRDQMSAKVLGDVRIHLVVRQGGQGHRFTPKVPRSPRSGEMLDAHPVGGNSVR
jgi:hypothetical protein